MKTVVYSGSANSRTIRSKDFAKWNVDHSDATWDGRGSHRLLGNDAADALVENLSSEFYLDEEDADEQDQFSLFDEDE